jgi:drug/metabolite transporter (DMT)-like permease
VAVNVGLGYAGAAAVAYGVYLFAYKRYFSDYPSMAYLLAVQGAALVWYLPVGALVWPADRAFPPALDPTAVAGLLGLAALIGVAMALSIHAVKVGDVSYVAPLSKLVPAFVLPIEVVALGAVVSPLQAVGAVVVTLAIYVANYEGGGLLAPFRRAASYRPAQLALASALGFAMVDVSKRALLSDFALPVPLVVGLGLAGMAAVALPLGVGRLDELPRRVWLAVVGIGLFLALAEHVVALAFVRLPASVASPVVNTQAIVAVVLGGLVLREAAFRRRFVAAVLAVAGVALVASG